MGVQQIPVASSCESISIMREPLFYRLKWLYDVEFYGSSTDSHVLYFFQKYVHFFLELEIADS